MSKRLSPVGSERTVTTDEWRHRTRSSEKCDDRDAIDSESSPELWEDLGLEPRDDHPSPPAERSESSSPEKSRSPVEREDRLDRGRVMAILSHMSVLFGIPVFLVPLVRRQSALALHHAKAAAVIFFAFYASLGLAMLGFPWFLPIAMALYLPGLVGIGRAVQEREAGHLGFGSLGERLFPWPKAS